MAIKVISPEIKKQYLDENGNPYAGGKLYVFEAGTTTLINTFTDESGGTPNSNPLILDSAGRVGGLYLTGPDSYKFRLDDVNDVTIWTVDNITIRDFGQEIDDINTLIALIQAQIASDSDQNNVKSGQKSNNSSRARYLIPDGASDEATILATATNLVYVIDGTEYTLAVDTVISGLNSAPAANNTAQINDSLLSGQGYTKQLGSLGSFLLIDNIGSEISALDNKIAAFKIGAEYFTARVDNANGLLREVSRGFFRDQNNAGLEPVAITNNDLITLQKLAYIFLKTDESTIVTYNEPVYSSSEPAGPATGDMWFDLTNKKWKRYSSTQYDDADCAFVGVAITDSTGATVGARPADFFASHDDENTFDLESVETSVVQIKSISEFNKINVFGNELKFWNNPVIWDITTDLDAGEVEVASVDVFAYLKENGDRVMSLLAPYNNLGDLKGYYHPYEAWRYVGKVSNDSASDFNIFSPVNSPEKFLPTKKAFKSVSADYRCNIYDSLIYVNADGGDRTVYLYPAALNPGGRIAVKMQSTASQNKVTVDGGQPIEQVIYSFQETIEYVSIGASWQQVGYGVGEILQFQHRENNNVAGGGNTAGSWQTRTLNTPIGNADFGSLAANQVTLKPGRYRARFYAVGYKVDEFMARLEDTTNSNQYYGCNANAAVAVDGLFMSKGEAEFEIQADAVFELQQYTTTVQAVSGYGTPNNFGVQEIYAEVIFERLRNN